MTGVLSDMLAHAVDDEVLSLCESCATPYVVVEGWQGYCPSCCALTDDHDAGMHRMTPLPECRECDRESDNDYQELPAIA